MNLTRRSLFASAVALLALPRRVAAERLLDATLAVVTVLLALAVASAPVALAIRAIWNTVAVLFAHGPRLAFLPTWAFSCLAVMAALREVKRREDGE